MKNVKRKIISFNTKDIKELELFEIKKMICGIDINKVATINEKINNAVYYINSLDYEKLKIIETYESCLFIINETKLDISKLNEKNDIIVSSNPRLTYAELMNNIVKKDTTDFVEYSLGVYVGLNTIIDSSVIIEPNVVIGADVTIEEGTIIHSGVSIKDNVHIGKGCIVRSNSVIGEIGFGIEKDNFGNNIRIPHIGGVLIGNNVDIGSNSSIASGTIYPTIIGNDVNVDNLVHIAHNCNIGESTEIVACVEISGSVSVGKNSYIGPNSTIIQKVKIGENVFVGINSFVNKDIEDNVTVMGSPALEITEFKQLRDKLKKLIINN